MTWKRTSRSRSLMETELLGFKRISGAGWVRSLESGFKCLTGITVQGCVAPEPLNEEHLTRVTATARYDKHIYAQNSAFDGENAVFGITYRRASQ
jgi:hypothetical protein